MKSDYYHCPMCGVNVCAPCMMEDSLNQSPKPATPRKPDKEESDRLEKNSRN